MWKKRKHKKLNILKIIEFAVNYNFKIQNIKRKKIGDVNTRAMCTHKHKRPNVFETMEKGCSKTKLRKRVN